MDIRLKETNENKFNVVKLKKTLNIVIQAIAILSVVLVVIFLKENRAVSLVIILLIYFNIIMFTRLLLNNFRIATLWRLLDGAIYKIENNNKKLEETLEEYDSFKMIMGKHYIEIIDNLKEILSEIKVAIEISNKNERMNIELVNNVTNKLDIPLEGILKNVKVLKEDNILRLNSGNYEDLHIINDESILNSLSEKSNNFKKLIDELFEASKVASGDIKLQMENIEIVSLLRQALVEFKEEIDDSNIIYKVNIPKEKIFVKGNGEKLWRIFGILIENTLKHSLENSRVYIDLIKCHENVKIRFRNTSKNQLNIDVEELVNIINNNNDEAASGLNLEIAKNLVVLQQGKFNLDIDADLFKVDISFLDIREEGDERNDR